MNWKLRLQNKPTLVALCALVLTIIYQVFEVIGFVPSVSESQISYICNLIIDALLLMGIVTDPTTSGLGDSSTALEYDAPRDDNDIDEYGASDEDPEDDELLEE